MDWVVLIAALFEIVGPLLEDCLNPPEEGVARLRRFGPRVQLAIYRAGHKIALDGGASRREARQAGRAYVDEAREAVAAASADELLGAVGAICEYCRSVED